MQDGDYTVDILDKHAKIVATKPRKEIIKGKDIYHAVYGIVLTPDGRAAISRIANRPDLPNLHAGLHGFTAATIRRSNETSLDAMKRAVSHELNLTIVPELYSEELVDVDTTKRLVSIYLIRTNLPEQFSKQDIEEIITFTPNELTKHMARHPSSFTPLLKRFWQRYKS